MKDYDTAVLRFDSPVTKREAKASRDGLFISVVMSVAITGALFCVWALS